MADIWPGGITPYLELYPGEDEPGYDGVHDGGIKGLRPDAPDEIKAQYKTWDEKYQAASAQGIKL